MTNQEFVDQYRVSRRAETRRLSILAIVSVVILSPSLVLVPRIIDYINQTDNFAWDFPVDEYLPRGILGCIVLMLAFAGFRVTQPYGVPCPDCGKKLYGTTARIALITGNCGFCGGKVLNPDGPRPAEIFKSLKLYD
jgi:hypothetical protein